MFIITKRWRNYLLHRYCNIVSKCIERLNRLLIENDYNRQYRREFWRNLVKRSGQSLVDLAERESKKGII